MTRISALRACIVAGLVCVPACSGSQDDSLDQVGSDDLHARHFQVGLAEFGHQFFELEGPDGMPTGERHPYLDQLHVHRSRLISPYDVATDQGVPILPNDSAFCQQDPTNRACVDWCAPHTNGDRCETWKWLRAAARQHVEVHVSFRDDQANRFGHDGKNPPGEAEFRSAFRAFRRAFPEITSFSAFGEPNGWGSVLHKDQNFDVDRAADYVLWQQRECERPEPGQRRCEVVAGDILYDTNRDLDGFKSPDGYLARYLRALEAKLGRSGIERLQAFAIHPYLDVKQHQFGPSQGGCGDPGAGVRAIARALTGPFAHTKIWLTEEGAYFQTAYDYRCEGGSESFDMSTGPHVWGEDSQAKAADFAFHILGGIDPRIERIYTFRFWNTVRQGGKVTSDDMGITAPLVECSTAGRLGPCPGPLPAKRKVFDVIARRAAKDL